MLQYHCILQQVMILMYYISTLLALIEPISIPLQSPLKTSMEPLRFAIHSIV